MPAERSGREPPYSQLRDWLPEQDAQAHDRARVRMSAHIAAAPRRRLLVILRSHLRRRLVGPFVAALLVAGSGAALASVLLETQHTEQLAVFTHAGTLSPEFHVGARGEGYCWTASLATAAANAFRCTQGNAIHDPCFAARPHARTVVCFLDPWHPVTVLHLTRPLPRHGPSQRSGLPWAIETTTGWRCTFLTGATAPMGGQRINYGCAPPHQQAVLIGTPDRHAALWTIHAATGFTPDRPGHPTPLSRYPPVGITRTIG